MQTASPIQSSFYERVMMENYIIIGVIAVLALIGIRSTVKHFKGQGACCGGGGYHILSNS